MTRAMTRLRAVVRGELRNLELRADALPAGVAGRMQGIALTYGVADYYGTVFDRGCLDRTRGEKLAAGKVKLLADHENETSAHVGVVRALEDVGDAVLMTADLFDTAAGRAQLEYLKAVVAAEAFTGLSVGFYARDSEWLPSPTGESLLHYREIELDEVSVTPCPAVPGTEVTGARREPDGARDVTQTLLSTIPTDVLRAALAARDGNATPCEDTHAAPAGASGDAPSEDSPVSMDERMRVVRQSYAHPGN